MKIENMLGTGSVIIEYLPSYMNTCSLQIKKINAKKDGSKGRETDKEGISIYDLTICKH